MNCTKRLKSKKVQRFLRNIGKKTRKEVMIHGRLPDNFYCNFKIGFKKGFMDSCKTRKKLGKF